MNNLYNVRGMEMKNIWKELNSRLKAQWIVCKLISSKKSVQYGIRFSYPIYLVIVFIGVFFQNPFILSFAVLTAFLGILLPMHPFDYVYNYGIAKVLGISKIPGRGSELQVNSTVALVFSLIVIALILSGVPINYLVLATIYILSSIFMLCIFLFRSNSNLPKKPKSQSL